MIDLNEQADNLLTILSRAIKEGKLVVTSLRVAPVESDTPNADPTVVPKVEQLLTITFGDRPSPAPANTSAPETKSRR